MSSAGFRLRGFILAWTKPRRLKPAPLMACAQDYTEPRLSAEHSFVRFGRSFKLKHFSHGPYGGERAERKRVLGIDR